MSCSKQRIPSSHFLSSIFQKKVQCNGQDAFKSKPEPDMFQKVQYSRQSLSCKWCSSTQWYVMEERENLFSENKRTSHHWYWTWHIYIQGSHTSDMIVAKIFYLWRAAKIQGKYLSHHLNNLPLSLHSTPADIRRFDRMNVLKRTCSKCLGY